MSIWDSYFETSKPKKNHDNENTICIQTLQDSYEEDDENYLDLFAGGELLDINMYLQKKKRLSSLETRMIKYILPEDVKTHKQFIGHIVRVNLFSDLFVNLNSCIERQYFPCIIFKKHFAWIDKDKNGIYRYFSMKELGRCRSFSVLDLISIVFPNATTIDLIRTKLIELLGCNYEENAWATEEMKRLKSNIESFENTREEWRNCFPSLYKLTKSYMKILIELINNNVIHPPLMKHSYKNMLAVYISTRYLSELTGTDASTISKAINLFSSIGLITKIPPHDEQFPLELLKVAVKIRDTTLKNIETKRLKKPTFTEQGITNCRFITFYTIPKYSYDFLTQIEQDATKLILAGVTNIKKINERNIANALGREVADNVFFDHKEIIKVVSNKKEIKYLKEEILDTDAQNLLDEEIPF